MFPRIIFLSRGCFFAASQFLHISYQSSWARGLSVDRFECIYYCIWHRILLFTVSPVELPQEFLQLGAAAICSDDPIPSAEDLADQIVEILNYFR